MISLTKLLINIEWIKQNRLKPHVLKITEFERENSDLINASKYKFFLCTLLYKAVKSRLDITFIVSQASRECENSTEADYKFLLRIL